MHRARKRLGLVVALGLALTPSWASAQAAPHRLAANVLAGLGGLASSAADPNAAMVVGVGLARPDPVGEAALYKQLYQSGNADYRRFLTPAQFAARFGVPADTYAATVSWLRAGGLSVDATSGSRDYVLATGTVAAVQGQRLLRRM